MGEGRFTKEPQIMAAIISVIGTIFGTLLISVLLGFLEGRIGLGPVVAVITFVLLLSIWVLLVLRWGLRLAGAAAAAMVVVGSVIFLIAAAVRSIPTGVPSATPVAVAPTATEVIAIATPLVATATPLAEGTPGPSRVDQVRAFAEPILAAIADRPPDFEDDFTTPDKGWNLRFFREPAKGDLEIIDGVVRMAVFEGSEGILEHERLMFKDFVLMVDSRQVSGSYPSVQVLDWGLDYLHCSFFIGSGEAHWHLEKHVGDQWYPGPEGSGDVVSPMGETNHILIVVRGPKVAVYLNDAPLAYVEDQDFDVPYEKWLSFACGGQPDMVCEFDNVKLWDISALVLPGETPAPIRTPTPTDQARAFAEPILAAIADRPPDFEDDFATADKGWDLVFPGKPPNGDRLEITDGVVRMTLFEGTEGMLMREWMRLKDFVLMVDSRQVSGSYDSAQMVVWGNPDDTWGQVAIQSGTAYWNLSKGPGDQWPPWPEGYGDVVSPMGETNHILIVVRGLSLAIYLNDLPLAYVEDQEIDVAWVKALSFNCGGQADMVCEFDNVKLWNLENVPGLP